MDGGVRQEEMSQKLKREIKENAQRRRWGPIPVSDGDTVGDEWTQTVPTRQVPPLSRDSDATRCTIPRATQESLDPDASQSHLEMPPNPMPQQSGPSCVLTRKETPKDTSIPFSRSDTILFTFYLEQVHPFLFPFYKPSPLSGGRSWILEMMLSSPVHQAAYLYQSSYLFSLAQRSGSESHSKSLHAYPNPNHPPSSHSNIDSHPEPEVTRTTDTFGVLREALQIIDTPTPSCTAPIHGSVRILGSILQVQHFELAFSAFSSWQAHLNGAVALFIHLLNTPILNAGGPTSSGLKFSAVMRHLGSESRLNRLVDGVDVQSAEQAAFRFAACLLLWDDVIASTATQEEPKLYTYHRDLLTTVGDQGPLLDLEAVIGCQNWVVLQIGEIAVLDAWKQQSQKAGSLDMMELVYRGTRIKEGLERHLAMLESRPVSCQKERSGTGLLDVFAQGYDFHSTVSTPQSTIATRIWAHAAFIYLSVVVSGWHSAGVEIRYHVGRVIDLLSDLSPPALVRTMVWPFCVAGCLAEVSQETHFRETVESLHPPALFGTVRYAFKIMEEVWQDRGAGDSANRDLAACFRGLGEMVLLV